MNTQAYTPKQQALLNGLTGDALAAMQKAIADNLFWAVGIDTCAAATHWAIAVTAWEKAFLACTPPKKKRRQNWKEEQDRYAEEIAEGDRDDDDEYEGELVAVRWDGGDTLEIWSENNDYLLEGDLTVARSMGE